MLSFEQFVRKIKLFIPHYFTFSCVDCQNCCGKEPGVVYVTATEIEIINKYVNEFHCVSVSKNNDQLDFIRYIEKISFLKEKENSDCIFWSKKIDSGFFSNKTSGCKIYPVRPMQCRNYPFWYTIFNSESNFNNEKMRCPGFFKGTTHYTASEIYKKIYNDLVYRHTYFKWILPNDIYNQIYLT